MLGLCNHENPIWKTSNSIFVIIFFFKHAFLVPLEMLWNYYLLCIESVDCWFTIHYLGNSRIHFNRNKCDFWLSGTRVGLVGLIGEVLHVVVCTNYQWCFLWRWCSGERLIKRRVNRKKWTERNEQIYTRLHGFIFPLLFCRLTRDEIGPSH